MFTPEEDELIAALRSHAEANILTLQDVLDTVAGKKTAVGDDPNFVINVGSLRVVFSIETQPDTMVRHLSVTESLAAQSESVEESHRKLFYVAEKLGITQDKNRRSQTWVERHTPFGDALNILQEVPSGDELLHKTTAKEQVQPLSP